MKGMSFYCSLAYVGGWGRTSVRWTGGRKPCGLIPFHPRVGSMLSSVFYRGG